jgi:hypothetical protein
MGMSAVGLSSEKNCAGEIQQQLISQTHPLLREDATQGKNTEMSKENVHEKGKKIICRCTPGGGMILGQTDRLAVGHMINITLTWYRL